MQQTHLVTLYTLYTIYRKTPSDIVIAYSSSTANTNFQTSHSLGYWKKVSVRDFPIMCVKNMHLSYRTGWDITV